MSATTIIGIDCATEPKKVGLAKATLVGGQLEIVEVRCGGSHSKLLNSVLNWIQNDGRVLLAPDAPLGWPCPLGVALAKHNAGMPIDDDSEALFRRQTDRVIAQQWRQRPLDAGADRIARTAHSALKLLGELAARVAKRYHLHGTLRIHAAYQLSRFILRRHLQVDGSDANDTKNRGTGKHGQR